MTKIDHINISVSDLASATRFFVELLGFVVLYKGDLQGEWIDRVVGLKQVSARFVQLAIPSAETKLELIQYFHPQGHTSPQISQANEIGLRHLAFNVKNIEKVYQKLKDAKVKIFSKIQTYNHNKKLCYFLGPDGVILEICEYGKF